MQVRFGLTKIKVLPNNTYGKCNQSCDRIRCRKIANLPNIYIRSKQKNENNNCFVIIATKKTS